MHDRENDDVQIEDKVEIEDEIKRDFDEEVSYNLDSLL